MGINLYKIKTVCYTIFRVKTQGTKSKFQANLI